MNDVGNVIIHIGLHKTATTFLQRQYFPYLSGVTFYRERRFYDQLGCFHLNERLLISNEGLSGVAWNDKWKNGIINDHHWVTSFKTAVNNLKLIYPDATILIVMRKHGDLLLSMYKQYIQEGGILCFDEFYNESGVIRNEDLCYQTRLELLTELFGSVHVLSFESFRTEGIAYFDRVFGALGLQRLDTHANFKTENRSISGRKIELLRSINKTYRHMPALGKRIVRWLRLSPRDIFQSGLAFWKPSDPEYLLNTVREVNEKFSDDWAYTQSLSSH